MLLNNQSKSPEIVYPCNWTYKLIGSDVNLIIAAVEYLLAEKKYQLKPSNVSSNNNYYSFSLEVQVKDEDERKYYYNILQEHPHIKIVL